MVEAPSVSIVVAVMGDRRVFRLLKSLLNQTMHQGTIEIIVVENGSAILDAVADISPDIVRYFHLPEPNMAEARNIGLNAARGRYLLITDADVVAKRDWVELMVSRLSQGQFVAIGGRIEKYLTSTWTQKYGNTIVNGQTKLNYLPALKLPYIVGANAGFITDAVRDVGGFDSELKSGNDVDICYKLGLSGFRVGLCLEATVFHEDHSGMIAYFNRFKRYAFYQVLLFSKYRHISQRWCVINTYPIQCTAEALSTVPHAFVSFLRGDIGPTLQAFLKIIEALGIWCGNIKGSIRFRQLYI